MPPSPVMRPERNWFGDVSDTADGESIQFIAVIGRRVAGQSPPARHSDWRAHR